MACTACKPCCCQCSCLCTSCCNNLLPQTLFGTITNINNCGCLPGACSFVGAPFGGDWQWNATLGANCGTLVRTLTLLCRSSVQIGWTLASNFFNAIYPVTPTCCPFNLDIDVSVDLPLSPTEQCKSGDLGKFHLKVTA